MKPFQFEGLPTRVIFGAGTVQHLASEAARMQLSRLLLITTPQQTELGDRAAEMLGAAAVARFGDATMHTPVDVTMRAMELVTSQRIDGIVSLGGGSTIGLGKAIALRTDLPQIVVPTTYAGSEMTPILGQTENGQKTTQRGPRILPEMVIYDVDLTMTLPVAPSVTSGLNAIAHAVEALYAPDGNPVTSIMAEEGVRSFVAALPAIAQDPNSMVARSDALYGAWLCGTCLGQVGMALHHKLCHTLGGTFNLPHAETHSVILPHAIAYNHVATEAMMRLKRAMGVEQDPWLAMHALAARLGAPTALRDIGMPESGITEAAALAAANPYPNPRPIDRELIEALLRRAWSGAAPAI